MIFQELNRIHTGRRYARYAMRLQAPLIRNSNGDKAFRIRLVLRNMNLAEATVAGACLNTFRQRLCPEFEGRIPVVTRSRGPIRRSIFLFGDRSSVFPYAASTESSALDSAPVSSTAGRRRPPSQRIEHRFPRSEPSRTAQPMSTTGINRGQRRLV